MAQRLLADRARRGSGGMEPEAVRIWLLDGLRVSVGSLTIEESVWRRRKAKTLIKLLALTRGHKLHRGWISALLWPGLDEKAQANNFHRTLHFARKALGDGPDAYQLLALREGVVSLCPVGSLRVDVEAFEEASTAARRTRQPAAYRRAMELYAGDLLPEDRYEGWVEERRRQLKTLHLDLLAELAALHEERGELEPAIEALQLVVANELADEEAHAGLMRLYATTGQRQRALLQYERLRQALSEVFQTEPDAETRRLYQEILADRFARVRPRSGSRLPEEGARHNLTNAPSSFVGREREVVEVKRSLEMTQLLTLTGTGGSGKTRLALEVARDLVGAYPDGTWLVEFAPLSDPVLAPQAVAAALSVPEQPGRPLTDTLADNLRTKDLLLVLDNCEHLVDATARLVNALLAACPRLRILATSREPLDISGEAIWPVPPLSLPDGASSVEGLMRSETVRLFVDRARSRLPGFELNGENAGAVGGSAGSSTASRWP